jgi:hypothetical protein
MALTIAISDYIILQHYGLIIIRVLMVFKIISGVNPAQRPGLNITASEVDFT